MYNNDREQENWKILKNEPVDSTSKIWKSIAQDRRVKKMTIFFCLLYVHTESMGSKGVEGKSVEGAFL